MSEFTLDELMLNDGSLLNPLMVKEQQLTQKQVNELKELHRQKDIIMRDAHEAVKQIEFEMQKVWGFDQDETRHTHRFRIPCPEITGD